MNEDDQADWWFKLGIYYGTVVFLIFYTPIEVNPENEAPGDYTGLENDYTGIGNDDLALA